MVCDFWAMAPMVNQYLDYTSPSTWPTPWELITEKRFDSSSIALGMEYTLLLGQDGRWTGDRLELDLICTADRSMQTLVLIVDKTHLLNYAYRLVIPLADEVGGFEIQERYRYVGKTHETINGNLSPFTEY